jgi:hypothetical protein
MPRNRYLILSLLATTLLVACQGTPSSEVSEAVPTATTAPAPTLPAGGQETRTIPATADDVPRMPLDQLEELMASPQRVLVIDTRSLDEYNAGHIPGAASMPLAQVETLYSQLPRDVTLVTYCA